MTDVDPREWYEQTKRLLRGSLPPEVVGSANPSFVLACHECGLAFQEGAEIGMLAQHAELAHGWDDSEQLQIDLVWIGEGDPPEPRL